MPPSTQVADGGRGPDTASHSESGDLKAGSGSSHDNMLRPSDKDAQEHPTKPMSGHEAMYMGYHFSTLYCCGIVLAFSIPFYILLTCLQSDLGALTVDSQEIPWWSFVLTQVHVCRLSNTQCHQEGNRENATFPFML
jgi:hypothetical protein